MNPNDVVRHARQLAAPYRIDDGRRFRLKRVDPGDTGRLKAEDKPRAKLALEEGVEALASFQERLYAQDRWGVLLVFQAMDAAGKDSAIKHVLSGVNPQGCQVHSFKAPSAEDLDHDFLWRCLEVLPNRGSIGIFNRSYYEEVLVVRVREEILRAQKLPPELVTKRIWQERFRDIVNVEDYLARNGFLILKFFLHVSKREQRDRFLERITDPSKNWKFSLADVLERQHWGHYMTAYEEMIRYTATPHAPWYAVPADNKWYTRLVVAAAIIQGLASLDLRFPEVDAEKAKELKKARAMLLAGRSRKAPQRRARP